MDENGPLRYTEPEAAMIARLAQVRVAADRGNRAAKQQIAKVARQLAALKKQAKRGNAHAARAAKVLEESGLLVTSQIFAMEGASTYSPPSAPSGLWSWQLGGAKVLPLALLATTGVLLWKRRWGYAVVPVLVFGAHEGHQKKWW